MPAAVTQHTAAYRQDADPLQPVFEAGFLVEDESEWTPTAILHGAYLRWADETQVPTAFRLGPKGFAQALSARFDPKKKQFDGSERRGYLGVKVGEGK
jgi:hypothetical protein